MRCHMGMKQGRCAIQNWRPSRNPARFRASGQMARAGFANARLLLSGAVVHIGSGNEALRPINGQKKYGEDIDEEGRVSICHDKIN